jgi:hypothetical protein
MVDVLVFELPKNGFESLRLVLPKEAVGVADPKKIGYEIEKSDIVGGTLVASSTSPAAPIGAVEGRSTPPTKADLEREIQSLRDDLTKPEGTTTGKDPLAEQPTAEKPPKKKTDAEEEFQELKRLIDAEKEKE